MISVINLAGQKFGRLTAVSYGPRRYHWTCVCECGREKQVQSSKLRRGETRSCGCLLAEVDRTSPTHGAWGGPEYFCWAGMIQRCTNPNASGWDDYGARGITVCERWRKFENFLADMGPRPEGYSIERERVNEGYSPENCRWASQAEQSRNTRRTRNYTIDGVTKCLIDWCSGTATSRKRYDRVRYLPNTGTPIEQALSLTE